MSPNAKKAFDELVALGARVYDDVSHKGAAFRIGAELYTDGDLFFADYFGRQFQQETVDGVTINPDGIREDVSQILIKYTLRPEWWDAAQVFVYDDSTVAGPHNRKAPLVAGRRNATAKKAKQSKHAKVK